MAALGQKQLACGVAQPSNIVDIEVSDINAFATVGVEKLEDIQVKAGWGRIE
jgi:hypothetical protein